MLESDGESSIVALIFDGEVDWAMGGVPVTSVLRCERALLGVDADEDACCEPEA
jgi:hypothetical protein